MEINNNSYKLSYEEALIALTGVSIYHQEYQESDDDILRVIKLIANSIATSRMYVSTRLEYTQNIDPSEDVIDQCCENMTSTFISIPKDDVTSKIIPRAIESYVWLGHESPNITSKDKINKATDMILSFMLDTSTEND